MLHMTLLWKGRFVLYIVEVTKRISLEGGDIILTREMLALTIFFLFCQQTTNEGLSSRYSGIIAIISSHILIFSKFITDFFILFTDILIF